MDREHARLSHAHVPSLRACRWLERMVGILNARGAVIPDDDYQRCFALLMQCYRLTEHVEEIQIPKKSTSACILSKIFLGVGNPRLYDNWLDGNLNKLLEAFCRLVSQGTFDCFLLLRMKDALKREAVSRCGNDSLL